MIEVAFKPVMDAEVARYDSFVGSEFKKRDFLWFKPKTSYFSVFRLNNQPNIR